MEKITNSFSTFLKESNGVGKSFMDAIMLQSKESALDRKTQELAYLAVLASQRMLDGLNFHVSTAKELGATRDEVKSAILVGLPLCGITLIDAFEEALSVYDGKYNELNA